MSPRKRDKKMQRDSLLGVAIRRCPWILNLQSCEDPTLVEPSISPPVPSPSLPQLPSLEFF